MDKVLIIIRKEYLYRVKTKSFFLITLLSPLLFASLILAPLWLSQIKSETYIPANEITIKTLDNAQSLLGNDIQIPLQTHLKDNKENSTDNETALAVAILFSFLIYLFLTLYGTQVMNGVIEEKSNRIVEIVLSSVKPFELMIGKIIGIGLVGLTQFLLWGVLTILAICAITLSSTTGISESDLSILTIGGWENNLNWIEYIGFFLFYFIGGYLLYASLFSAVGAIIDNPSDAQQFVLPLMIPLIFGVYTAIYGAQNPEGPLAFWGSLIPFTSPVVMMARLPFDVPLWEKLLSMTLLICTFIGSTLLSSRIYRNGVLMYGKKGSYKEIWKWLSNK